MERIPPSFLPPINFSYEFEDIRKMISAIELTLKTNYQQLLDNTADFEIQIKMLANDLQDIDCKIKFLIKTTSLQQERMELKGLLDSLAPLQRQIQVFSHIFALKSIKTSCD